MISLFALMLLGSVDVAEAHPVRSRHHHRSAQVQRPRPTPPPTGHRGHNVSYHKNHWTYPHSNSRYVWRWTFGHYNRRGHWVPGHWSVVIRF